MCIAIQEIREEGKMEGIIEGKMEGIIEGAITFAQKLGVQKEQVKKSIMEEYDKDDKEAEELINAYWK